MDKDGTELRDTIGKTWHNGYVQYRTGLILHCVIKLLQLQEGGEELFIVSQIYQMLEIQFVCFLKELTCLYED